MSYSYKEETLIQQFTPWFVKQRNYIQLFEDTDTSGGDPVDSAGFIDRKTTLIEFKDTLGLSEIYYAGSTGGSIEKKIRTVLSNLYGGHEDRITRSLVGWNEEIEPLFVLVANHLSDSVLKRLDEMLALRCRRWHFGYEVIIWQDAFGTTVLDSPPLHVSPGLLSSLVFPDMPSTAPPRSPGLSIDVFLKVADQAGVSEISRMLLAKLESIGARRKGYSKNNINYFIPPSKEAVIGVWPFDSSFDKGLLVTYWLDGFQRSLSEDSLPGVPGPRKGHLGASRYLRSAKEMNDFIEALCL